MHLTKRLIALSPALVAALALPAIADTQQGGGYYGPHMWHGGWYGFFFGPVMMIALIAVAIVVVVLLLRWLGGSGHGAAPHAAFGKTPLDILKERFARGEIDKDEFEERRHLLSE